MLGFAVAVADARGDEPTGTKAGGRVVEGKIVAAGNKPIEGATVLFGKTQDTMALVEGVTATTDGQGLYRADLGKFPWSTGTDSGCSSCHPATKPPSGKFRQAREQQRPISRWPRSDGRRPRSGMEDSSGRPVAGESITCSVGGVIWSRIKTDALGCCRIAMPPHLGMRLSTEPKDARPIEAYLGRNEGRPGHDHAAVPAANPWPRARPRGRPVPNAAVGRWLTFEADGTGEMLPFFGGALAVTDRDGNFKIAPALDLRFYKSRPAPKFEALCFADPSFREMSYQLFEPNRPIRMAYQLFDPNRPVEPMSVTLKPSRRVRIPISRGFVTTNRETRIRIGNLDRAPQGDPRLALLSDHARPEAKRRIPGTGRRDRARRIPARGNVPARPRMVDAKTDERIGEARREIVVPRGEGPLDLPPLVLELPDFQKMVGKPALEIDATDLDTGRPVKLADFRGKVVVLDFWGYWCGPCVGRMPKLMELDRKFAGRPLAILALHDQSIQSRVVYDRKIAKARERMWGGRDLPFRVLLDRPDPENPEDLSPEGTGTTCKRYGITGFPTLYVIDQDGTMIGALRRTIDWSHSSGNWWRRPNRCADRFDKTVDALMDTTAAHRFSGR